MSAPQPRIAVIVPCYNEEVAVASVVTGLREALPEATVFVYDNASTDATAEVARAAGAEVRFEGLPGKGNAVRRAFADVDADVYLMIDGDATYDAAAAPRLVEALLEGPHDMVVGTRVPEEDDAYRPGHELGNRGFNVLVSKVFGSSVTDMLSGYRAFSRRFVKTFPAASTRFAIETELTVHAINHRMPVAEVPVGFRERPEGSESKLSTISDGLDILRTIVGLLHHERPLWLYPAPAALMLVAGLLSGTGSLDMLLTALGTSLLLAGMLLQGVSRGRREHQRAAYLQHAAVGVAAAPTSGTAAAPAAPSSSVVQAAEALTEVAAEVAAQVADDLDETEVGSPEVAARVADEVAPVEDDDRDDRRVIQMPQRPRAAEAPPVAEEA